MNKLKDELYTVDFIESDVISNLSNDRLSEKDKFQAAQKILLGLAILYLITLASSFIKPANATELLDICKTIYPPLCTLILANYFRDKG